MSCVLPLCILQPPMSDCHHLALALVPPPPRTPHPTHTHSLAPSTWSHVWKRRPPRRALPPAWLPPCSSRTAPPQVPRALAACRSRPPASSAAPWELRRRRQPAWPLQQRQRWPWCRCLPWAAPLPAAQRRLAALHGIRRLVCSPRFRSSRMALSLPRSNRPWPRGPPSQQPRRSPRPPPGQATPQQPHSWQLRAQRRVRLPARPLQPSWRLGPAAFRSRWLRHPARQSRAALLPSTRHRPPGASSRQPAARPPRPCPALAPMRRLPRPSPTGTAPRPLAWACCLQGPRWTRAPALQSITLTRAARPWVRRRLRCRSSTGPARRRRRL